MTKEEIAGIMKYCKDNGVSYKARLAELGIRSWRFYEDKARYAREQAESPTAAGEFLQLTPGGEFIPTPSFAATTGNGKVAFKKTQPSKTLSVELRTPTGAVMRIQGELSLEYLQAIIQASSSRV